MTLGKIIKELVCTIKDPVLNPAKIYIVRLLNLDGTLKNRNMVAIDNGLGLGIGDVVLLITGSGSRKLQGNRDMPIDCAISAKVESINIDDRYKEII